MVRFDINLASRDYFKKRIILTSLYGAMLILILLLGVDLSRLKQIHVNDTAFDARISRVLAEKRHLQDEINKLGRGASEDAVKATQKEIRYVNDLIYQKNFLWTAFLTDLEAQISGALSVGRVQPDFKTDAVIVGGVATSLRDITEFVGRLQKAEHFEDVFLIDQQDQTKEGKKEIAFSVRFRYLGRGGGK